jgi:hypothetical protein
MSTSKVRLLAEFALPTSAAVGLFAALGAGGLAALAGQPAAWAVVTGLGLGLALTVFGVGFQVLVALEKAPAGVFTPAAAYWAVAFPLAMLVHAGVTELVFTGSLGLPEEPLWQFLAYHALLSMGFAIGFIWVNEQIGRHWWPRIREHNPYAFRVVEQYKESATVMHQRKEASAQARRQRRAAKARGSKAALRS